MTIDKDDDNQANIIASAPMTNIKLPALGKVSPIDENQVDEYDAISTRSAVLPLPPNLQEKGSESQGLSRAPSRSITKSKASRKMVSRRIKLNATDLKMGESDDDFFDIPWYRRYFNTRFYAKPMKLDNGANPEESLLDLSAGFSNAIHPFSLFMFIWSPIIQIIRLAMILLLPLCLGFEQAFDWLPTISMVFFVFSVMDIFFTSRTGIIRDKEIEMDVKRISRAYCLSTTFAFDLITSIPWCWIADSTTTYQSVENWCLRLLSLLNALPFIKHTWDLGQNSLMHRVFHRVSIRLNLPPAGVNLIQIIVAMCAYWHWSSSSVAFLKHIQVIPDINPNGTWVEQYTLGFYSSAAEMLEAGFGAELPVVVFDRWFKIGNMLIGALFSATFIGNISSFIIGLDSSGRLFNEKIEEVNQFIEYKGFDDSTRKRLLDYYHFKYSRSKYFDEKKIMSELNEPLRQRIALQDCQGLIVRVPFFKDADDVFISQVVMILKLNHYLPQDNVIEEGTTGDQMFFIASGSLQVLVGGESIATLSTGRFFGEIAVLFGQMKRTATIRATTNCVLYSLSRQDLNEILETNPAMATKLRKIAEERMAETATVIKVRKESALFSQTLA